MLFNSTFVKDNEFCGIHFQHNSFYLSMKFIALIPFSLIVLDTQCAFDHELSCIVGFLIIFLLVVVINSRSKNYVLASKFIFLNCNFSSILCLCDVSCMHSLDLRRINLSSVIVPFVPSSLFLIRNISMLLLICARIAL